MAESRSLFLIVGKGVIASLTILAAVLGIYAFFEKKAEIKCDVISNNNVIDIRENLSKLDILYDSTSIKARNGNLRLVSIRVSNSGTQNILKEFYDDNDPFGFQIANGKIIERPELTQASNDYLKQNLNIFVIDSSQKLTFSKVILEPGEFFIVKFLVLHDLDKIPQFSLVGKIAGIREFLPTNYIYEEGSSFWSSTLAGPWTQQLVRFIVYGGSAIGIFVGIIFYIVQRDEKKKKARKQALKQLENIEGK